MHKIINLRFIAVMFTMLAALSAFSGCAAETKISTEAAENGVTKTEVTEIRNNGEPYFTDEEISAASEGITYGEVDALGRATGVTALLPAGKAKENEEYEKTSEGYHLVWYDSITKDNGKTGARLWYHCHLLRTTLGGVNDKKNLITGTYSFNYKEGMLTYEKKVEKYLKKSNNHVLYRVTPQYTGDNLIADGVLMEALSLEDNGEGLKFCVYINNIQPGISINYENGLSYEER